MDLCLLILFCRLVNIKSSVKRIIYSAFLGALSDCLLLYLNPATVLKIVFGNIIIPAFMIVIILYGNAVLNVKVMLKYVVIWYFCAFASGGIVTCIFGGSVSIYELLGCAVITVLAGCLALRRGSMAHIKESNENTYGITIYKRKKSLSGFARYDSANTLYEPVSGSNVIVCSIDTVRDFLTEGEKRYIELFPGLPDEWDGETMLRSIPYSSVGKRRGCMPGIILDRVCISKGRKKMIYKGCYLAISDNNISIDKTYDFLLNYKMKL